MHVNIDSLEEDIKTTAIKIADDRKQGGEVNMQEVKMQEARSNNKVHKER